MSVKDLKAEFKLGGRFQEWALSSELLDEIESTDEDDFIFRGKRHDSREELCEKLIRKLEFQPVSASR